MLVAAIKLHESSAYKVDFGMPPPVLWQLINNKQTGFRDERGKTNFLTEQRSENSNNFLSNVIHHQKINFLEVSTEELMGEGEEGVGRKGG